MIEIGLQINVSIENHFSIAIRLLIKIDNHRIIFWVNLMPKHLTALDPVPLETGFL